MILIQEEGLKQNILSTHKIIKIGREFIMKEKKAFVGGTLIDGTGREPIENAILLLEGSKIVAVGEGGEIDISSDAKILDFKGKTIIPGLIDSHVHLTGARVGASGNERWFVGEAMKAIRATVDVRNMLFMGYTAVRDCGSRTGIWLKKAIEERTIPGPRIMTSGETINNTYGHIGRNPLPLKVANTLGTKYADGVPECLLAVRTRLREGSDFIKISSGLWGESRRFPICMPSFSYEEIYAICEEAHRSYTTVASHCQGKNSIMTSLKAGVDTIEHGREFDEECAKLILEKDGIYSPTLAIVIVDPSDEKLHRSEEEREQFNKWQYDSVRIAHEKGVKIASGSDFSGTGTSGYARMPNNALDLERLVTAGLTPMEALVSATKISSETMMMENKIGTLERGKLADLVVVNGNPLENIKMLQEQNRIGMVLKGGEIVIKRF
jgi:imidazolonepropionase-like amidohydrolase